MTDYTIEEFCDFHNACSDGRSWAMDAQAKWLRENTKPNFGGV